MKNTFFTLCLLLGLGFAVTPLYAQLSMPAIFADHMILQREKPIQIWGKASPGEKVTVLLNDQKVSVKASGTGEWKAVLKSMEAGGPYALTVSTSRENLSFSDILIGEVWVCSGQSNMEFRVRSVFHADQEMATANYPQIRSFNVAEEMSHVAREDFKGKWEVCSPATVGGFSAVGYFFAREIYNKLNIPVGFIHTSWGGTDIETWMSMDVIEQFPKYEDLLKQMRAEDFEEYVRKSESIRKEFEQAIRDERGVNEKWYATDYNKSDWNSYAVPGLWAGEELGNLDGVVWFSYEFALPEECLGKEARVSLGQIDDDEVTWINGKEVGSTVGHDIKRFYTIPAGLLKEQNVLTIKVVDHRGGGGLYGSPEDLFIQVGEKRFPLSGDWQYKIAVSNKDYDFMDYGPNSFPSLLYNAMVNPMVGYGIRGVIWYQGENNANRSQEYYTLFPAMINNWRTKWNDEFPFYWVQLANYMQPDKTPVESQWADLRNAQSATLSLPRTGQAVIIDIGEADDIHPRNKQDVGKRLAYHALHKDYGFTDIVYSGPVFQSMEEKDGKLILSFDPVSENLDVRNKYGYVSGFAIAGTDGKYYWAQGRQEGNHIILWNDDIKNPVSVRYAWGNNPDDANLYNSAGLPASPFQATLK